MIKLGGGVEEVGVAGGFEWFHGSGSDKINI